MLIVFDHCLKESKSGGQTRRIIGIYLISYACLIRFLLALNFVFSKAKMFKLPFILFVIKQLLGNVTLGIDIYSAKQSIIQRGKAEW